MADGGISATTNKLKLPPLHNGNATMSSTKVIVPPAGAVVPTTTTSFTNKQQSELKEQHGLNMTDITHEHNRAPMSHNNEELLFGENVLLEQQKLSTTSTTGENIQQLSTIVPSQPTTVIVHPQPPSSDVMGQSLSRPTVQRNISLPNIQTNASQPQQQIAPPISPNHKESETISITINTIDNDHIHNNTNNGQVVTKKKGRFKFVEQMPIQQQQQHQRTMNDVSTLENADSSQPVPVNVGPPLSTLSNAGAQTVFPPPIPPTQQQPNSPLPPTNNPVSAPPPPPPPLPTAPAPTIVQQPEGLLQQQTIITTPNVQKKGRFVVTTLPLPTALNSTSGGTVINTVTTVAPTTSTIPTLQQVSVQQQQQLQQFQTQSQPQQQQQHSAMDLTHQYPSQGVPASTVEANHTRRPSDSGMNAILHQVHSTSQSGPMNLIPGNATSPGHSMTYTNTNLESNSPINTTIMNIDDSLIHGAAAHYDPVQQSTSSSSRQASPKISSKPNVIAARYNTTGMTPTLPPAAATMQSTTAMTALTSSNVISNSSSTTAATVSSLQISQQRSHQPPGGFGKMLYFLDQMRLEVTEADQSIKNLQTDMKCLKEKNKELEAKARDMERKYNQEKALREVAETRVKALKKKLRAYENISSNNGPFNTSTDTSMDGALGIPTTTTATTGTNKDDESVGTNQTLDKQLHQQPYEQS